MNEFLLRQLESLLEEKVLNITKELPLPFFIHSSQTFTILYVLKSVQAEG